MLYLVRKLEESIVVNNDVVITVIEIKRNSVKLGVTFSQNATVLRKEIYDRICKENQQAAESLNTTIVELPIDAVSAEQIKTVVETNTNH